MNTSTDKAPAKLSEAAVTVPVASPTPTPTPTPAPTPVPVAQKMKTCTILLRLDKFGSTVIKEGVTPAEALFLTAEHKHNANAEPVQKRWDEKTVERTTRQEYMRLLSMYAGHKVKALFPGASPNFPVSYDEAVASGMGMDAVDSPNQFKLI